VRSLHTAYRDAGSQILVTNTFAAQALALEEAGAGELCDDVNRAGVALAREAGGGECLVWASIGPLGLGLRLEDYPDEALEEIYRKQCLALIEADALLLETFVEPREAKAALAAAAVTGRPVIFQIGNTGGGGQRWERVDRLLDEARRANVAAVWHQLPPSKRNASAWPPIMRPHDRLARSPPSPTPVIRRTSARRHLLNFTGRILPAFALDLASAGGR
jgi:hypothetical protein